MIRKFHRNFSHWKSAPLFMRSLQPFFFFLNIFILLLRNYWFRCVLTPHRPNVTRLFDGWGIASSCAVIPFFLYLWCDTYAILYARRLNQIFFLSLSLFASCCYFIEWINEPNFFFVCVLILLTKKKCRWARCVRQLKFQPPKVGGIGRERAM